MEEVLSLLTENGLYELLCKRFQEINFKCTMRATNLHTGNCMWDDDYTTAEMTSDDNDEIVDIDNDQSEVETDHNHNCVGI